MGRLVSDEVRKEVLAKITPSKKELENQKEVISSLKEVLIEKAESIEFAFSFIEPQGSTGLKQTQLRNAADIDLFVGLNPSEYSEILELPQQKRHSGLDNLMTSLVNDLLMPAVTELEVSNVRRTYSQHPYLSLEMNGLEVDILGCFDIDSKYLSEKGPITAVDRTVHHTRYVADNLTEEKRENARILKSFVRGCHAYGDRCAVGRMGLTGVSLELISIISVDLNDAFYMLEHLDENPVDPENRTLAELRKTKSFRDNHIFLIDPTDHRRNIASSFTPRSYRWVKYRILEMRRISKQENSKSITNILLEKPIPTTTLPNWLKKYTAVLEFKSDGSSHYTILRDKLYRLARKSQAQLLNERTGEPRFGLSLVEVYFEKDKYSVGVIVEKHKIGEEYQRRGPPVELHDASEEFRKSHPDSKLKDGFYWVIEKRDWVSASDLFEDILLNNPIEGLTPTKLSDVSKKVLNVLWRFVLPIEPEFNQRITTVKDKNQVRTG